MANLVSNFPNDVIIFLMNLLDLGFGEAQQLTQVAINNYLKKYRNLLGSNKVKFSVRSVETICERAFYNCDKI